jgi:hypothetical protein
VAGNITQSPAREFETSGQRNGSTANVVFLSVILRLRHLLIRFDQREAQPFAFNFCLIRMHAGFRLSVFDASLYMRDLTLKARKLFFGYHGVPLTS